MSERRQVLKYIATAASVGLSALGAGSARSQCVSPAQSGLSADDAQADLRLLQLALAELHPGLTRYVTVAQIDAAFDAACAAMAAGGNRAQMVLLASQLCANVHCGHTWANPFNQRKDVLDEVFTRTDKLPLTLRWVEGHVLVTGSSVTRPAAGDELLAIDERPVSSLREAIVPLLRADGLHPGAMLKRLSQLNSGPNGGAMDRLFPLLFPPRNGRYSLTLRERGSGGPRVVDVPATSLEARDQVLAPPSTAWTFRIDGDTGLLTLPTFAFWQSDFKPEAFLQQTFDTLRGVPCLVIDLRDNEGGDDAIGHLLLRHLLKAPLQLPGFRRESAYERVPYGLARHLDTWDFGFFDRTGQVLRGPGRNWLMPDQPGMRIEPASKPYAGRILVLIGPQNSSAGFMLARAIQRSGAAVLLGQPTGGHLRGLNSGQLAWITLPASGVAVDIPLVASWTMEEARDGGVLPDVAVSPRWTDALAGIDTEMVAARAQLRT
jgi:hypothetical protein